MKQENQQSEPVTVEEETIDELFMTAFHGRRDYSAVYIFIITKIMKWVFWVTAVGVGVYVGTSL